MRRRSWPAAPGTGLSGGSVPVAEGIVIGLARMNRILELDAPNRRARVQPGVANLDVSRAAAPHGLRYAPDPSSQQVCTIGGNVAENSGGAHCLKHGFTVHHVQELEVVLASGDVVRLDRGGQFDLLGAFIGSEGTLGIATEAVVGLLPLPERVETLLAAYPSTDAAGRAVSAIIAAGILPAAVEMMDTLAIEAAELAVGAGLPVGAGAVLLVELDGPAVEVEALLGRVARAVRGARRGVARGGGRRGPAGPLLVRPQGRLRRGRPAQPRLLRAGRRGAAHAPSRGAGADRPAVQASTACGWQTSSTPATATCIRWSCTTPPPARPSGPSSWRPRS